VLNRSINGWRKENEMKAAGKSPNFRNTFTNPHVVLPVIHVESESQALSNAQVALDGGADGVFLINHSIDSGLLLAIHSVVADRFSEAWTGVNCLGLSPADVFRRISDRIGGVWADNAMIDESSEHQPNAQRVLDARQASNSRALYFGGVAFKYQRHVDDLASAALRAANFMDVVTTSGPGTGQAAHVDKIRVMKQALGAFPLAIASGITPENVASYLPYADCFLVATGISTSFTELSPYLLQTLVDRVRSYGGPGTGSPRDGGFQRFDSVCFVCEWNEGRSAHLELSVRHRLREADTTVKTSSAGLSQGGVINELRRDYLARSGIPRQEIDSHHSTVFGIEHAQCDLVLVAENQMKDRLLAEWSPLKGRVMTIRGFALGHSPENDLLSPQEAHLEDAAGHDDKTKLALYAELEELAGKIASRLRG